MHLSGLGSDNKVTVVEIQYFLTGMQAHKFAICKGSNNNYLLIIINNNLLIIINNN